MSVAHAAELAFAQSTTGSGGGAASAPLQFLNTAVFMVSIVAIFYFIILRPQQKQKREREGMLQQLKKGDRVVTTSGLHGTILTIAKDDTKDTVVLRVSDQVKLEFDRAAVGRVVKAGEGDG